MKYNIMMLVLLVLLAGCTYKGENLSTYIEEPATILKDPHFGHYQEKRDALESQYLKKEITYSDYMKGLEEIDNVYTKEVQERDAIIQTP